MTPQEADPDLPVSVQESLAKAWVALPCSRAYIGPLEELKSLLMKVKEESEKVGLKQHFKNSAFRSWHPVTSLHGKYGETMETTRDFILGAPQINCSNTADGYCSHEIKRCLLLGGKTMKT